MATIEIKELRKSFIGRPPGKGLKPVTSIAENP